MQPNTELQPDPVDNADRFTDPFFERFRLRPAPAPLQLTDDVAKTYSFPTFYADVTCAVGIFLCSRERARALLPHPSMEPVKMPGGRAVVLFSCYEYRNVMNLAPYNEIAMTIPIMVGGGWAPPVLPLVVNLKGKGYHVFSMPVTSLENQIRGRRIWGLPKIVEAIDIDTAGDACTTRAADEHGRIYFELTVPKAGKARHLDESGILYSVRDGELLRSRTCFEGDFTVSTRPDLLWKRPPTPGAPVLRLGDSPRAEVLRTLDIEPVPFQVRYCPSMNSCFDLPLER